MISTLSLSRKHAAWLMVLVTLLWSTAGVVSRQLEQAGTFEATFWRSFFNAVCLGLVISLLYRRPVWRLLGGGWTLWASGFCWSLMFTCFMVAVLLTTVANVLVTMSLAPLIAALLARAFWGQATPWRTWLAIAAAGAGITWMYASDVGTDPQHLLGTAVAAIIPLAGAVNWLLIRQSSNDGPRRVDLLPAVFIGACISALTTLPLALPWQASTSDVAWLAALGVFQLALPCTLAVLAARSLPAPEMALLATLEIIFGVALAWLGAGEVPSGAAILGGGIVMLALAGNEAAALAALRMRRRRDARKLI